jgi:hypothetical protein
MRADIEDRLISARYAQIAVTRDGLAGMLVLTKRDMRAEKRMFRGAGDEFRQGRGDHGWSVRFMEACRTGDCRLNGRWYQRATPRPAPNSHIDMPEEARRLRVYDEFH